MTSVTETDILSCKVKWFSPAKGYGFVVSAGIDSDILLHSNVLKNFGKSTVANDVVLDVKISSHLGRLQVTSIERFHANSRLTDASFEEITHFSPDDLAKIALAPARVKWFDISKGIGFANVFGERSDVFIHADVLRLAGLASLEPGEAIALRVVQGDRGLFAAEVSSWL